MEDIIARQVRDGSSNPLKSKGTKSELTPLLFRYVEENSGSVIGMFLTLSNCLGDVVVTAIVAKSEGLMDMETFRQEG